VPDVLLPEALTTLDSLKQELGISFDDISQDSRLKRIINRVTGWIEGSTERKLKARNYNGKGTAFSTTGITSEDYIYFSGTTQGRGGDTIYQNCMGQFFLPAFPVQTVSPSLTVALAILTDRLTATWDTSSYVLNSNFTVDYENGILTLLTGPFNPGVRNYRLTCTAGLLTSSDPYVPSDLEGLCLELCKQMYRESRMVQSESIGTWSRTYNVNAKDPFLQDILSKYARHV
jgi:hypothetical protein